MQLNIGVCFFLGVQLRPVDEKAVPIFLPPAAAHSKDIQQGFNNINIVYIS
jgi:hypothetical protein